MGTSWKRKKVEPSGRSYKIVYFIKWAILGLFLFYFHLFNTVDSKQVNKCSIFILPMTGFELQISGIGSDRSTN